MVHLPAQEGNVLAEVLSWRQQAAQQREKPAPGVVGVGLRWEMVEAPWAPGDVAWKGGPSYC